MIRVNELRIGNYIQRGYSVDNAYCIHKVTGTEEGAVRVDNGGNYAAELLLPIPLTPDWLERCGFEYMPFSTDISMYSFYKKSDLFELIIVNKGIRNEYKPGIHYYNNERHPVFFVHQLQNLYFALIGEELNVKL